VVEAALEALPQGLPDTYVRILERIEVQSPYMRNLAMNCLAWTIYAQRTLSTEELQQALAVNSDCQVRQDLQTDSPQVILEACGNLLEEANGSIRPIHYTVQEFLTTAVQGLTQQNIQAQLLDLKAVHRQLSLACLAYIRLTALGRPAKDAHDLYIQLQDNSFAGYACQSFDSHIFKCGEPSLDIVNGLETLLQQESACLAAILQIKVLRDGYNYLDISQHFNRMDFLVNPGTIVYSTKLYNIPTVRQTWVDQTPPTYALHLAAAAALTDAVLRLLEVGCNINEKDTTDSTPLYYACRNGHEDTAWVLTDKDADVNAQGGYYGNALQAASAGGHEQVVKTLLDKGADINAQGGEYGNALQAASARGHEQIVKMLLDKCAEVNAQGGEYGNALQAASARGYEQVVKMLLDKGAEVNAQGGDYGNALQAASAVGYEQVVKVLLDKGAAVNAQGGLYGNALQAASYRGHEQVVKMLLNKGAAVNAQGGDYGNALQAASLGGYEQVVKMLLDKGAAVNAQGGLYGNALQAASAVGYEQVVKVLLDKGAEVNAQGGLYGNALQAASAVGYEQVVKMLLDKGAKVNVQGGYYDNALQAASEQGHEQVVKILLDAGAHQHQEDDTV
jgi:ankyrin repeat protein